MAAARETADLPRPVAMRDQIGDQRLEAARKAPGDGNRSHGCTHRDNATRVGRGLPVTAPVTRLSVRSPPGSSRGPMMGTLNVVVVITMMGGLRRDGKAQKDRARDEQSHTQYRFAIVARSSPRGACRTPRRRSGSYQPSPVWTSSPDGKTLMRNAEPLGGKGGYGPIMAGVRLEVIDIPHFPIRRL
jgi:hypothetical protein